MIANLFSVSIDTLIDESILIEAKKLSSNVSEYINKYYDIELIGWNDGATNALILSEDNNFLYYQRIEKKNKIHGLIGKKYIASITQSKGFVSSQKSMECFNREYFCDKLVNIDLACKDGFIKGFFDFRSDDYRNVVIQSFSETKI